MPEPEQTPASRLTFSEAYRHEIQEAFHLIDLNGQGLVSHSDLVSALTSLGANTKEWARKKVRPEYSVRDFTRIAAQLCPNRILDGSLVAAAAAYRRRFLMQHAEQQLSLPIPTWPKPMPNATSGLRAEQCVLCPPTVYRPHWQVCTLFFGVCDSRHEGIRGVSHGSSASRNGTFPMAPLL